MAGAFDSALNRLEAMLDGPCFSDDVNGALKDLGDHRPVDITAAQLRRFLTVCYRFGGITGPEVEVAERGDDRLSLDRIGWHVDELLRATFQDTAAEDRAYLGGRLDRRRAFRDPPGYDGEPDTVPERPHIPLHRSEAADLLAPFLTRLEAQSAEGFFDHLKICWDVLENPLPPFEGLFWQWLETRGEAEPMRRARAFSHLSDKTGRRWQRASWTSFHADLVPQLDDEHPLVVTHVAQFLAGLFADASERFFGDDPWSLVQMLDHLRGLGRHRRPAAGGFLSGFDGFDGGPLTELRRHPEVLAAGFDVEAWVIDVLSDGIEEPFLPGSQMFWFYLHEEYCEDAPMVERLIEAGHDGIAWMCITEVQPPARGMEGPLARLAGRTDGPFAKPAAALLRQMQSADKPS